MRRPVAMAVWIVVIVSAVLLLPSTASAQTINACVSKNGMIRIVAAGEPCPRGDAPLQWNSGLRVYDRDGVEIGPLTINSVVFSIGEERYSAGVGPEGWIQSQLAFYYLNDTCTGDRYVLRSGSTTPVPPPLPQPAYFHRSLQVVGTTGYYQNGDLLELVVPAGEVSVWRWDLQLEACLAQGPYSMEYRYWLGANNAVELASHPAPFTIR